ncbi:flagellar biosynthesis protein FlhF [Litchfieldella xinjiangensis]|uniref:flagellar biosynthesis protein FlhF n=1 Tax=Litchfieldella xinjiangensis TaxID=1166948 RepID=UPI0005BAED0F|nr:flagellar biosynthesis protein FlhF [Halomonas xinjiangensis]
MSVQRFLGSNSRDAMRQVRAALGDEALILSNRHTEEGVEILAMADEEHGRLTQAAPAAVSSPSRAPEPVPVSGTAGPMDFAALSERLLGEMHDMRALLNRQAPSAEPVAADALAKLRQRLWSVGIGSRLAAELLATLPTELDTPDTDEARLDAWLVRQLVARLRVAPEESELLDAGGVIALVGPTGVGKTTTTAKLAARYVMRHGSQGVALVTTDSYRVGAHEQLRIYARLLGVEVHALDAEASLSGLLERLAGHRLVIIDTVGMSQRDQRLVGQVAQLGDESRPVRLMLVLNAASHGDTLEDVVTTYANAARSAGNRLDDCLLTKSDEAARLGPLLDTVIRHGLCLHYVSNGQQVPEDLRRADPASLVDQALAIAGGSPFAPLAEDVASVPSRGRQPATLSLGLLAQGRALTSALSALREGIPGFTWLEQGWDLAHEPPESRALSIASWQDRADVLARRHSDRHGGLGLLWGPQKVSGCEWGSPVQALDSNGLALGIHWQHHRLPAGQDQRLGWAGDQLGADRHVLAQAPDALALDWLGAWQIPWLAPASGGKRVHYAGERLALNRLPASGETAATLKCRWRGRSVVVRLVCHYIDVIPRGPSHTATGQAWVGQISDADTGQAMGIRFWLSSELDMPMAQAMLSMELGHSELPGLTRHAWRYLSESGHPVEEPVLRLGLASGLSAVAQRLDRDEQPWAMDVRAQLHALQGGKAQRKPKALLDAMLSLFSARDVFRQVGRTEFGSADR